uniref:ZM domain-containing protein n=1 Tax=Steinernema glaseri TaxID=37863 RepID=A0A1I7Z993_9BILA
MPATTVNPENAGPEEVQVEQPNATMETKVSGGGAKRVGRWSLAQLRQTDGIIPSQAGWNKGDSQKLMTNFGTPRNTSTRVKAENLQEIPEDILNKTHGEVRLQSGTNKFASQRGMVNFGTGRDVCREGVSVNQLPSDLQGCKTDVPNTIEPFGIAPILKQEDSLSLLVPEVAFSRQDRRDYRQWMMVLVGYP